MAEYDVVIVGAGNAALAASVSAVEYGAEKVLVLEKASEDMRGGNTHWSGGVFRFAFDDPRDLEPLLPGIEGKYKNFYDGVTPYTHDDFLGDLVKLTDGRTDPELSEILVSNSRDTVMWMFEVGKIPMEPDIKLLPKWEKSPARTREPGTTAAVKPRSERPVTPASPL